MNKSKKGPKSTYIERSPLQIERPPLKSERSPVKSKRFTAHKFKLFRKKRGYLIKKMRERRGLTQGDLGAPSQIRRMENGEAVQISTLDVLVRLIPCPRELMKLIRTLLESVPIACLRCRKACTYKDCNEKHIIERHFDDLTVDFPEDFEVST